jgi:hypothetical protein
MFYERDNMRSTVKKKAIEAETNKLKPLAGRVCKIRCRENDSVL